MKKDLFKKAAAAVITGFSVLLLGTSVFAADIQTTVREALKSGKKDIDISAFSLEPQKAMDIYLDVVAQSPDLFYVNNHVDCKFDKSTGKCLSLICSYSAANTERDKALFNAEIEKAVSVAKTMPTEYDKIKAVHDYIIVNYGYDQTGKSVTAYDMVKTKTGICTAYTGMFKAALDKLGIKSEVAISNDMGHEWLVVEVGGKWYNADLTWDDPIGGGANVTYANFLKSDRLFGMTGHYNYTTPGNIMCTDAQYDTLS